MALPLFAYGTLRDPDLRALVLGRPALAIAALPAKAPGYRAVFYPERSYPALLRTPGAAAEGLLLLDLSPFERDLLDAYEGAEYRRGVVAVMVDEELHEAEAYLPTQAVPQGAPDWRLDHWQVNHKPAALIAERATVGQLRARLLAARPN